jgi:hypothetical protein
VTVDPRLGFRRLEVERHCDLAAQELARSAAELALAQRELRPVATAFRAKTLALRSFTDDLRELDGRSADEFVERFPAPRQPVAGVEDAIGPESITHTAQIGLVCDGPQLCSRKWQREGHGELLELEDDHVLRLSEDLLLPASTNSADTVVSVDDQITDRELHVTKG